MRRRRAGGGQVKGCMCVGQPAERARLRCAPLLQTDAASPGAQSPCCSARACAHHGGNVGGSRLTQGEQRQAAAAAAAAKRHGSQGRPAAPAHLLAMNRVDTAATSSEASWLPPCWEPLACDTFI